MRKGNVFTMGHADVFQDKPSEETKRAIESMHKDQKEQRGLLIRSAIQSISTLLADKSEAELSIVLKVIVNETNRLKQDNNTKN